MLRSANTVNRSSRPTIDRIARLAFAGLVNFGLALGKYEVTREMKTRYFSLSPPRPQIALVPVFSCEITLKLKIEGLGLGWSKRV